MEEISDEGSGEDSLDEESSVEDLLEGSDGESPDEGIDQEFEEILKSLKRQALHAHTLGFVHPTTNEEVFFVSELPDDLNKLKNRLETLKN